MAPVVIGVTANGRAERGLPVSTAATRTAVGRTRSSPPPGVVTTQSRRASRMQPDLRAASVTSIETSSSGASPCGSHSRSALRRTTVATMSAAARTTRVSHVEGVERGCRVRCLEHTRQSRKAPARFVGRQAARDWNPDASMYGAIAWPPPRSPQHSRVRRRSRDREPPLEVQWQRIESDTRQHPRRVRQPGGARLPQDPACGLPRPERGPDCPPPATRERQRARASRRPATVCLER